MQRSHRTRSTALRWLIALTTVMSTGLLSAVLAPGTSAHAAAGATSQLLTRAGTFDPLHAPVAKPGAAARPISSRSRGALPIHAAKGTPARTSNLPQAGSSSLAAKSIGKLLANFNGVSSQDSAVTNFGAKFEPPDQGLCSGNGFVLEAVNSAFSIYHKDGSVAAGPFNVNDLFGEGPLEFTSDPRCYYDPTTHTWFAIILFIAADNLSARTDIAVNPSGNPLTPWTVYHLDATDNGTNGTPSHPGCPCYGDQPLLGIDPFNLYVSTNEFSILGPEINGAQIYAISKADLIANLPAVHFVHFDNLSIGGNIATSVQPAINPNSPEAEWFLNSLDPFGDGDNRLGVWALTHQSVVASGGIPTLSSMVIPSEFYISPPNAVQRGSSSLINTGDDRMYQVVYRGGSLWGSLGTEVSVSKGVAPTAGAAWFKIFPHLYGDMVGRADMAMQGYLVSTGNFLYYPALDATPSGTAAMVMTISGPSLYPSAAYSVLPAGGKAFGSIVVAAPGFGPYDAGATRWGDYSAAALDPSGSSIWLATEYIPPLSSQTVNGENNWGTRVLQVDVSG